MKAVLRWLGLLVIAFVALQLFFVLRIAAMVAVNPESTTFQRSEAWTLLASKGHVPWRQQWVPYADISDHLKRAVIASEDDGFVNHDGVDWNAIEKAWERNAKAEAQASKAQARAPERPVRAPKIRGGSTITQQLAKNLFLSGSRSYLRKGQELVLAYMIEHVMSKERILELYLNVAEWGVGVFGAQAAAKHYFNTTAANLGNAQSARLAAMLPNPRFYDSHRKSNYLNSRVGILTRRMQLVDIP